MCTPDYLYVEALRFIGIDAKYQNLILTKGSNGSHNINLCSVEWNLKRVNSFFKSI